MTLPSHLQHLKLNVHYDATVPVPPLPLTLTKLWVDRVYLPISYTHGMLPESLRTLSWKGPSEMKLAQVPLQIESLSLWENLT
jgi:hypothetical protein